MSGDKYINLERNNQTFHHNFYSNLFHTFIGSEMTFPSSEAKLVDYDSQ